MKLQLLSVIIQVVYIMAKPLSRDRRFVTPTTYAVPLLTPTKYPVPTIDPILDLLASGNLNCPHKRDADKPRVMMDEKTLRALFLSLVGDFDRRMIATSVEEASNTFINLLPEPRDGTSQNMQTLKSTIVQDLDRLFPWLTSVLKAANVTFDDLHENEKDVVTSFKRIGDVLDRLSVSTDELQQLIDVESDLKLLRQLRLSDVHERRVRRQLGGSTSSVEYCHPRGDQTSTGYLHMCTTCALTTTFSADRFPRYINEASCDSKDCNCFTVRGINHGRCQPTYITVKMLKRSSQGCMMVFQNGQQVITDKWELYDQQIRTGCECVFNKNSMFAPFIGRPTSR